MGLGFPHRGAGAAGRWWGVPLGILLGATISALLFPTVLDRLWTHSRGRVFPAELRQALDAPVPPVGCRLLGVLPRDDIYEGLFLHSMAMSGPLDVRFRTGREGASLTTSWLVPKGGGTRVEWREGAEYQLRRLVVPVPSDRAEAFRQTMEAIKPETLNDLDARGLDGMMVEGTVCAGLGLPHTFGAWSPRSEAPRHYAYFVALLQFGLAVSSSEEVVRRIENVLSDLQVDLPIRDLAGSPHTYRIYGGFPIHELPDVKHFLEGLSPLEPIVFDFSNFGGAADAVEQEWARFDHSRPNLTWVATGIQAKVLAQMGISPERIVPTLAEARARTSAGPPATGAPSP
jgi:hypothetical protein